MLFAIVLASPAAIILISITRLLIVSNYQTSTAVAVAATSGAVTTLLGTLIPLVPIFLPYVTLVLILASIRYALTGWKGIPSRLLIGSTICLVATLFVSPTSRSLAEIGERGIDFVPLFRRGFLALLVSIVIVTVIAVLLSRGSRRAGDNVFNAIVGTLAIGIAGFVVLSLVVAAFIAVFAFPIPQEARRIPEVARKAWLPAEQLRVKQRSQVIVGYVLPRRM